MKLLIIEDNRSLVESLRNHLGRSYSVDTANTGKEGTRRALNGGYDVILLDLHLPDQNGYEIYRLK